MQGLILLLRNEGDVFSSRYHRNSLHLFTNSFRIRLMHQLNLHYFLAEDLPFIYYCRISLKAIGYL